MLYPSEEFLYAAVEWQDCSTGFEDILYHKSADGIAKITINRPQVRNAFRPQTVKEMINAFADARFASWDGNHSHDYRIGAALEMIANFKLRAGYRNVRLDDTIDGIEFAQRMDGWFAGAEYRF